MIIDDVLKKILNGESAPTTGQFRTGMGSLFDFIVGMLGEDSTDYGVVERALQIGDYGHRGLVGSNDAAAPNSKFSITTVSTTYRNAQGGTKTVKSGTTLTGDIGVAGPAINGRDQAAPFGASTKVNLYKIYDGTTEAMIASLAAPSVGPVLPSGYTYWAYAGTIVLDGSANMRRMYLAGSRMYYQARQLALSASPTGTEQAVSFANYVPTFAGDVDLNCFGNMITVSAVSVAHVIRLVTNVDFDTATLVSEISSGSGFAGYGRVVRVPNLTSQSVINVWGSGPNSVSSSIGVQSFSVPNGAI